MTESPSRPRLHMRPAIVLLAAAVLLNGCSQQPTSSAGSTPAPLPQAAATSTPGPSPASATYPSPPTATAGSLAPTTAPAAAAAPSGEVLGSQPARCTPGGALTPAQTEGPYYKANPPQRASLLESGIAGTRLTLTGYVFTADCKPVSGARVDFWQADDKGQYDNSGYRLRGYQLTDASGRYSLETIVPGLYTGRTEHIHVKVQSPGGPVLTTQLYFPDVSQNSRDSIFDNRLLMDIKDTPGGKAATFNFVIAS